MRKPLGELEGDRVAHLERGREVHLRDLALHRLDDLRPAVAGVYAPQARGAVEHLAALWRPVIHALGTGKEARRLLELPVRRERHPEGSLLEACRAYFLRLRTFVHAENITPFSAE